MKVRRGPDCWIWTASTKQGYGQFLYRHEGEGRLYPELAHRVSYMLTVGPIPEGYEVDHLCRVKLCVRPDHLEAVTKEENLRRQHEARRGGV